MYSAREYIAHSEEINEKLGADTWINELVWREFYYSIMDNYQQVLEQAFNNNFINIRWSHSNQALEAWKKGLTGYPIVDAGMRQLHETGWMHNRARMITASFLTKDLLINWQEGEKWFMEKLIDGDAACNNGGWQWCAGTGTDAAPYFRIFNPVLQSKKFDPDGVYIRRWVPELLNIPSKYIHSPWEMPLDVQSKFSFVPGKTYPNPIIDHALAREITLAAYKQAKPA